MSWIKLRLTEQGTWRGIIHAAGGIAGLTINAGVSEALSMLCVSVIAAGVQNIVTKG